MDETKFRMEGGTLQGERVHFLHILEAVKNSGLSESQRNRLITFFDDLSCGEVERNIVDEWKELSFRILESMKSENGQELIAVFHDLEIFKDKLNKGHKDEDHPVAPFYRFLTNLVLPFSLSLDMFGDCPPSEKKEMIEELEAGRKVYFT